MPRIPTCLAALPTQGSNRGWQRSGVRAFRKRHLALAGAIIIGCFASPAAAAREPSTRLIRCGTQSCLLVSGHRANPASAVSINGQAVSVEGKHDWSVRMPIEMVRRSSAPYARTIEVALHDPITQQEAVASVDLPIGLLGNVTNLASLEISLR